MKKLIIAITSLLIMVEPIVAGAGVVTVSDPGQAESKLITTGNTVPFVKVSLTASNVSGSVFFTVSQKSNSCSQLDIDLFAGSMSNKLTEGSTVIGPFSVQSGQTNNVVVYATINGIIPTNSSPTIGLDLIAVSNSTPGVVIQGTLPINGTTYYVVDTNSQEVVEGKFTLIQVWLNYEADVDTNGVPLDVLYVEVKADPLRLYQVQYSEDLISWTPISDLFGGFNDWMQPAGSGIFGSYYVMRLPPHCCYRLMSKPQ